MNKKNLFNFYGKITFIEFLIYLVIIPLLLVLIFLFPHSITDIFRLKFNQPNVISIFFSNYTHQALSHLMSNLIAYVILMILILNIEKNKKELYGFSIFGFFVFPFIIYFITLFFLNIYHLTFPPTLGFSGIVAFFNGYFFYCLYKFLKAEISNRLKPQFVVFLLVLDIIVYALGILNIYLILLSLFFLGFLIWLNSKELKKVLVYISKKIIITNLPNRPINWKGFIIFLLFLIPLFTLMILLPTQLVTSAGIVNTPAHFFGLIMGIFIPYFYELIKLQIKNI